MSILMHSINNSGKINNQWPGTTNWLWKYLFGW